MTKGYLTSIALTAAMTIAGSLHAQAVRLAVSADSKLSIEGGSNLHGWTCKATSFDAAVEVEEDFFKGATITPSTVQKVQVKVPVRNIK